MWVVYPALFASARVCYNTLKIARGTKTMTLTRSSRMAPRGDTFNPYDDMVYFLRHLERDKPTSADFEVWQSYYSKKPNRSFPFPDEQEINAVQFFQAFMHHALQRALGETTEAFNTDDFDKHLAVLDAVREQNKWY